MVARIVWGSWLLYLVSGSEQHWTSSSCQVPLNSLNIGKVVIKSRRNEVSDLFRTPDFAARTMNLFFCLLVPAFWILARSVVKKRRLLDFSVSGFSVSEVFKFSFLGFSFWSQKLQIRKIAEAESFRIQKVLKAEHPRQKVCEDEKSPTSKSPRIWTFPKSKSETSESEKALESKTNMMIGAKS